jgi:hypothetical protein
MRMDIEERKWSRGEVALAGAGTRLCVRGEATGWYHDEDLGPVGI